MERSLGTSGSRHDPISEGGSSGGGSAEPRLLSVSDGDAPPGRFMRKHFVSGEALIEVLQHELLALVNDENVVAHLEPSIRSRILGNYPRGNFTEAQSLCALLSQPHRTALQHAVLKFIEERPGMSACLKPQQSDQGLLSSNLPPATTVCYGREEVCGAIVAALAESPQCSPASVAICGLGGIGKTTLALNVLNDPAVAGRFGDRRLWVNCEFTASIEAFLKEVFRTLSALSLLARFPTTPDALAALSNYLRRLVRTAGPIVVAFDNLETIFDTNPGLVEATISAVCSCASILITLRGQRVPSLGTLWTFPTSADRQLASLRETAWLPAFEAHAGRKIAPTELDAVNEILCRVRGYPLALALLGKSVCRGNYDVKDLHRAWHREVSRASTASDSHLTSLHASIRLSLDSPIIRASEFATGLLFFTAIVPGGFYHQKPFDDVAGIPSDLSEAGRDKAASSRCRKPRHTIKRDMPLLSGRPGKWYSDDYESSTIWAPLPPCLPQWLVEQVCRSDDEAATAWNALRQSGLAYTVPEIPDRLCLLPAIREVLLECRMFCRISADCLEAIASALQKVWESFPHWKVSDEKHCFGYMADPTVPFASNPAFPVQLRAADRIEPGSLATYAHCLYVLALVYRHKSHFWSSATLLDECIRLWSSLNDQDHVLVARAHLFGVEGIISGTGDDWQAAAECFEREASEWRHVGSNQAASAAMALALCCHRRCSEHGKGKPLHRNREDLFLEAVLWKAAGRTTDQAAAQAEAADFMAMFGGLRPEHEAGWWAQGGRAWVRAGSSHESSLSKGFEAFWRAELAESEGLTLKAGSLYKEAVDLVRLPINRRYMDGTKTSSHVIADISTSTGSSDMAVPCWDSVELMMAEVLSAKDAYKGAVATVLRSKQFERDRHHERAREYMWRSVSLWESFGWTAQQAEAEAHEARLAAFLADERDELYESVLHEEREVACQQRAKETRAAAEARGFAPASTRH